MCFCFYFWRVKKCFFFFGILTTHCVLLIHVDEKISQKSCDVSKSSFINNMPVEVPLNYFNFLCFLIDVQRDLTSFKNSTQICRNICSRNFLQQFLFVSSQAKCFSKEFPNSKNPNSLLNWWNPFRMAVFPWSWHFFEKKLISNHGTTKARLINLSTKLEVSWESRI